MQAGAPPVATSETLPNFGLEQYGVGRITVSHGAALLQRQHDNDRFLRLNGMFGLQLSAVLHTERADFEFGWLGVFSGDQKEYQFGQAGDALPTNPPLTFLGNATVYDEQVSDLNSFEFNLRSPAGQRFRGILGLRYINLMETLVLNVQSPPLQSIGWQSELNNNLFGIQAGGDFGLVQWGRFQLSTIGKVGVYANAINHEGDIVGVPAPGHVAIGESTTVTSFLGELQLLGTYQLTPFLLFNTGYQAYWFENVALMQDQISAVNLPSGGGINRRASPIYHGAVVQAVVTW